MGNSSDETFGVLFKKLRLQAGIATITELGKLLTQKGYLYEDSLLSHWQKGRKIPVKRTILLALVSLFVQQNPKISLKDLNAFLESAHQGYLTDNERESLFLLNGQKDIQKFNTLIVPQDNNERDTLSVRCQLYLKKLSQSTSEEKLKFLEQEIDDIMFLLQRCFYFGLSIPVIKLWQRCGRYLWDKGRWSHYSYYGELAYASAIKMQDKEAQAAICIQDLGWCYFWQGDLPRSQRYITEGLSIAEQYHLRDWKALGQQRLGKIYQGKHLYKNALTSLHASLQYYERCNAKEEIGDTLTFIGETYWMQKDRGMAKKYLQKALLLVEESNDLPQKAIIYSHLGGIELLSHNYITSKTYYKDSIALAEKLKRKAGGQFWNNLGLGLVEYEIENMGKVKEHFSIAKQEMNTLKMSKDIFQTSVFSVGLKEKFDKIIDQKIVELP